MSVPSDCVFEIQQKYTDKRITSQSRLLSQAMVSVTAGSHIMLLAVTVIVSLVLYDELQSAAQQY
jgi:hypothetical protein